MTAFLILLLIVVVGGGVGFAVGLAKAPRDFVRCFFHAGPCRLSSGLPRRPPGRLAGCGGQGEGGYGRTLDHDSHSFPCEPASGSAVHAVVHGVADPASMPAPAVRHPLPSQAEYFQPPSPQLVGPAVPYSSRQAVPQQAMPRQPVPQSQAAFLAQQPPVVRETPEAAAARKAKRDQQNINVTPLRGQPIAGSCRGGLVRGHESSCTLPLRGYLVHHCFVLRVGHGDPFPGSPACDQLRLPSSEPAWHSSPSPAWPCTTSFSTTVLLPGWSHRCWARPFMHIQQ